LVRCIFLSISAIVKKFSMVTAGAAFIALGVVGFPATAITLNQGYDPGLDVFNETASVWRTLSAIGSS
jgi:hypothetical protein